MHKHRRPQFLGRLEHREQPGIAQVPVVDMAADLHPGQAQFLHATGHFADCQFRRLHRQGAEADKAPGIIRHDPGNMIVEKTGDIQRIFRPGPIIEHHRDGGEHLHIHPAAVALLHSPPGIPAVILDFAKKMVILHHPGTAGFVMVQLDKSPVTKLLLPYRHLLRDDMGMNIDFQHLHQAFFGGSITAPQFLQVRLASF